MVVFDVDYPGGVAISNVKFRVLVWIVSEGIFLLTIALNYLPRESSQHVCLGSIVWNSSYLLSQLERIPKSSRSQCAS